MSEPIYNQPQAKDENGIDVSLTLYNLSLTYNERIIQHQQALDLRMALEQAGRDYYAKSQCIAQNSTRK